jgi:hypothetical protein
MDVRAMRSRDPLDAYLERMLTGPQQKLSIPEEISSVKHLAEGRATRNDAAILLEQAYDALNRIQAILGYLNIIKRPVPGISQFLNEAKHTYEQALSHYGCEELEGAKEFAAASGDLSQIVEILIARTLRTDSAFPSSVPPPPKHASILNNSTRLRENLKGVDSVLARVHWLIENGTLPLEDRDQVRRIAGWGEALYRQARRMGECESEEDATELARAARAAADSAEHVCRNWYLGQVSPLRVIGAEEAS